MLLAGLRRVHAFADAPREIPRQWAEFRELGEIPGRVGSSAYGVMCGTDTARQTMEYMCAVEVASFDALPASLGRMRVPAATYAVFTHRGNVASIADTWGWIWREWLPRSGVTPADTPDFELYDERYDARTGDGDVEIWFPVAEAAR